MLKRNIQIGGIMTRYEVRETSATLRTIMNDPAAGLKNQNRARRALLMIRKASRRADQPQQPNLFNKANNNPPGDPA